LPKREAIELNQAQVDQLLGYEVGCAFITDALQRLGCGGTVKLKVNGLLYHHHIVMIWQFIKT
jgi:phenylalanyl-tRNA synthetase beta subunit